MISSYTTHKKRGEIAGFGTLLNATKGNPYHDKLGRFTSKGVGSKSSGKDVADKNYRAEQEGVDVRDGHTIGTDYANLVAQLDTARTNLKTLERDSKRGTGSDVSQKSRYLTRQAEIARAISQAKSLKKIKPSKETTRLVSEIQSELKQILSDYENLGTKLFEKQK